MGQKMDSVSAISQTYTAISNAQLSNQTDIAVLKKTQDAAKEQGNAAVRLVEAAANVGRSQQPVDVLDLSQY